MLDSEMAWCGVIDPVIIAESGRFQSGERRPSARGERVSRLARSAQSRISQS